MVLVDYKGIFFTCCNTFGKILYILNVTVELEKQFVDSLGWVYNKFEDTKWQLEDVIRRQTDKYYNDKNKKNIKTNDRQNARQLNIEQYEPH